VVYIEQKLSFEKQSGDGEKLLAAMKEKVQAKCMWNCEY